MDQRTALVAQHEGVDRREQQLAPAGLAAEQYAAERLALPLAAEHLPGFDVLFLIVPFAPIRVAGVEQGGVGVAGGHHEAGNRLFGPFVEIERRKVLTVEQRVSAAYDVAGGIARSERHGVAAELFDQRKRRGRDVPYQQGASGAECGAEPFDEGRIFRRADAVEQDELVASRVERSECHGQLFELPFGLRFRIGGDPHDVAGGRNRFADPGVFAYGPFVGQGGIGVAECGFHALEQRPRAVQRKPGIVTGVECGGVGAEPFGLDARNSFPVGAEPDAVLRFHGTGDVVESDFERLHAVPREVGNRGVAGIQTALHGDRFERFARESLHAAFLRFEGAVAVDYRDVGRGSGVAHAHLADAPRFALALPFEHQRHVAVMTDDGRQVGVGLGLAVARNPVARMVAFTGDAHPFVDLGDVAFDDRFGGVDFQRPFRQISSRQGRSGVATKPSWGANGRSNRVCDCAEFSAPYRPPSSNSSGSSFLVMADNC